MHYAGFWKRFCAGFVDGVVWVPLMFLFGLLQGVSIPLAIAATVTSTLLAIAYSVYFHGRWGRTIGKMALRIRVVGIGGAPITWKQAWLRYSVDATLGAFLTLSEIGGWMRMTASEHAELSKAARDAFLAELMPGYVVGMVILLAWYASEFVVMQLNSRRRALHDYIAGTVVILDPPR